MRECLLQRLQFEVRSSEVSLELEGVCRHFVPVAPELDVAMPKHHVLRNTECPPYGGVAR